MSSANLKFGKEFFPISNFIIQIIAGLIFLVLPFFYKEGMITKIFRTDTYLIWFLGCVCWIYNSLFVSVFEKLLVKAILVALIYVWFLCLVFPDERSFYAFINLISYIGIFFCFRKVFSGSNYYIIIFFIGVGFSVQLVIGFSQALKSNLNSLSITGQMYNSGFFANYLVGIIPLFLSAASAGHSLKVAPRIIWLFLFMASTSLLVFTSARAAITGLIAGSFYIVWISIRKVISMKMIFLYLFGVILISAILLYKLKPESAFGRLTIYRISLNMIRDHPFIGVGPNRFAATYNNYQERYFSNRERSIQARLFADNTLEAFNIISQIVIEYGFIGIGVLIWMLYRAIRIFIFRKPTNTGWLKKGSKGCVIAVLTASLFSNPFHVSPILLLAVYHLAIIFSNTMSNSYKNKDYRFFFPVSVFIFCGWLGSYTLRKYIAEKRWYEASELAYGDFPRANSFYQRAYPYLKQNGEFLFNYGAEACLAGENNLSVSLLEKAKEYVSSNNLFFYLGDAYYEMKQYKLAETNYLHSIYMVPSHVYPKYQVIKLYLEWDKLNQANYWINQTLRFPLKVRSPFIDSLIKQIESYKLTISPQS